jgi:hypothetical protein
MDIGLIAPLFILGLICAVFGWGMVYLSSQAERRGTRNATLKNMGTTTPPGDEV